jgi:RimJ/RimL family protein N-acetyltransferase
MTQTMIRGDHVVLRAVRDCEECIRVFELYNDLSQRAPTDHDEIASVESRVKAFEENGLWTSTQGLLLIVGPDDDILGTVSFRRTTELECDIGYRILRTEHRGRGVMAEAIPLFCRHLFGLLPAISRLQIRTADNNLPSRRLAERCGFVQEGVLRKAYAYRGRVHDWVVYGLLREECSA